MKLKKGQKVKVYDDPLTCQVLEEEAELSEHISTDERAGTQDWYVRFPLDENYGSGVTFRRVININNH